MWKTAPEIIRRTLAIIQSESTNLDTRFARVFTDRLEGGILGSVQLVLTLTVTVTQTVGDL